jgi:hypothetical protein
LDSGIPEMKEIKMSREKWIYVIFPIHMIHESNIVTKGTKYVFKGGCLIKNAKQVRDDNRGRLIEHERQI